MKGKGASKKIGRVKKFGRVKKIWARQKFLGASKTFGRVKILLGASNLGLGALGALRKLGA